jgi:hypothetical protein
MIYMLNSKLQSIARILAVRMNFIILRRTSLLRPTLMAPQLLMLPPMVLRVEVDSALTFVLMHVRHRQSTSRSPKPPLETSPTLVGVTLLCANYVAYLVTLRLSVSNASTVIFSASAIMGVTLRNKLLWRLMQLLLSVLMVDSSPT